LQRTITKYGANSESALKATSELEKQEIFIFAYSFKSAPQKAQRLCFKQTEEAEKVASAPPSIPVHLF